MLDSLAAQVDAQTRAQYAHTHARLVRLVGAIQDKAALRGLHMETMIHDWQEFNVMV